MKTLTPETKTITDKEPTLEEMQEFVGGYIQVVQAKNGDDIVFNEEGRIFGLPINYEASEHWLGKSQYDDLYNNILGNVLILKGKARLS